MEASLKKWGKAYVYSMLANDVATVGTVDIAESVSDFHIEIMQRPGDALLCSAQTTHADSHGCHAGVEQRIYIFSGEYAHLLCVIRWGLAIRRACKFSGCAGALWDMSVTKLACVLPHTLSGTAARRWAGSFKLQKHLAAGYPDKFRKIFHIPFLFRGFFRLLIQSSVPSCSKTVDSFNLQKYLSSAYPVKFRARLEHVLKLLSDKTITVPTDGPALQKKTMMAPN